MLLIASTFTRPDNATAYTAGDLVANSATASEVAALEFSLAAHAGREVELLGFRLRKSAASVTNAAFRLHLYSAVPIVATTGDNGVFASVVSGFAGHVAEFSFSAMLSHADGAVGYGFPSDGFPRLAHLAGATTLYGLLEANGAYTPAAEETFTAEVLAR